MRNNLVTLILVLITLPHLGLSQDDLINSLSFEVNKIHPPISITKEQLHEAHTLTDLNKHYPKSWIRDYISVEISASYKDSIRQESSQDDILTQEQKGLMKGADAGTKISVSVHYIPENTLKYNEAKEINFSFTTDPENDATYIGGTPELKQYLKEKAIDKIPDGIFEGYNLAAVKFTINEQGEIINPHLFWSSNDEKIDELLLEAVRNMPCWEPAIYANGLKVKQEFALTVGNMENCAIPLLNIRRID